MNKILLLILIMNSSFFIKATMYKYTLPFAYNEKTKYTYLLKEEENKARSLYIKKTYEENDEEPFLSMMYSPSYVSFFPDQEGFSFVQDDILYIKTPELRLARALEFTQPLYQIMEVQWQTVQNGIIVAKKGYTTGIFSLDDQGIVTTIKWYNDRDCYFPMIYGSELFYVERKPNNLGCWNYAIKRAISEKEDELIYEQIDPLGFLLIKDSYSLFYITSSRNDIDLYDGVTQIHFFCISLSLTETGNWKKEGLFDFYIPKDLLEAYQTVNLKLLMPRLFEDMLFYSNYLDNECDEDIFKRYFLKTKRNNVYEKTSQELSVRYAHVLQKKYPLFLT